MEVPGGLAVPACPLAREISKLVLAVARALKNVQLIAEPIKKNVKIFKLLVEVREEERLGECLGESKYKVVLEHKAVLVVVKPRKNARVLDKRRWVQPKWVRKHQLENL